MATTLPVGQKTEASTYRKWTAGTLTYTTGGLSLLFCWLLWGDFAWSMRDRAVPQVMQLLFKKFGASDMLVGVLFSSLPLTIGLIVGPFLSYYSDRLRTRWGRRLPFLILTTPLIVVSIFGLAFSPQIGPWLHGLLGKSSPGLNASTLIILGLFWTFFEFGCGIANMIYGCLVNDVVPQPVIGRFYGFFRILSLVAGIIFSYWILGHAETHSSWIFLGVGMLYAVGFTLMCWKVKEGEYPPIEAALSPRIRLLDRFVAAAKTYFKDGYSHPYYLWLFAATILAGLSVTPFNLYSIFYAKSLGMEMAMYGKCQAITYVISLCLAYPLGALCDRFHPLRMVLVSLVLYIIAMLVCALTVNTVQAFALALIAQSVLTGFYFTVSASLWLRLLPRDKFASIGSAGGTLNCLVGIAFAPAMGWLLDAVNHDYRYTFYVGFCIALAALIVNLILHRRFMALGGPVAYQPPQS